jgi:hypothetical protein
MPIPSRILRWAKASVNGVLDLFKVGDSMKGGFVRPL